MAYKIVESSNLDEVEVIECETEKLVKKRYSLDTEDGDKQQLFLSGLKDRKQWIQCACNDTSLIYIGSTGSTLYLYSKSDSQRPAHNEKCNFAENNKPTTSPTMTPFSDADNMDVFRTPDTSVKKRDPGTPQTGFRVRNANKNNKLFTLLRLIAESAQLNVIHNGLLSSQERQQELFIEGASKRKLNGVPVNDVLAINTNNLALMRNKLFTYPIDGKYCPTALLIWIADEYDIVDRNLTVRFARNQTQIIHDTTIGVHHTFGAKNGGPFLVAALYRYGKDEEGKMKFSMPISYVVPIVAKDIWMFVDSANEREMANNLIGRSKYFSNKNGVQSSVSKPLCELTELPGENITPDFDLTIQGNRQFVEVMGFTNWEYLARKEETIKRMRSVAKVWEFDATQYNQPEQLKEASFNFALRIFRAN